MTWVRLDDKFHRNPKALQMSDAAHRIYVDAMSYCSDCEHPIGFLSQPEAVAFVRGRGKPMSVVAELVRLGAWEQGPDGYLIHDYEKYVPPRNQAAVVEWRTNKRAEWDLIGNQSASNRQSIDSEVALTPGYPVPVPEPVPVTGSLEPPVAPLRRNRLTWPIDNTRRHGGTTPLADSLPVLMRQPKPREEAI